MRFEFDGSEGRVSVRVWEHPGARRLVVIAHGYGEHIERYDHVARALRARGAAVYGPDHLGHGRSAGERVVIADVEHVVDDVVRVVERAQAACPGLPVVLLGHSMGGLIATRLAQRAERRRLAGLVLSGPAIGLGPALAQMIDAGLADQPLDVTALSRDAAVGEAYAATRSSGTGPGNGRPSPPWGAHRRPSTAGRASPTYRCSGSTAAKTPWSPSGSCVRRSSGCAARTSPRTSMRGAATKPSTRSTGSGRSTSCARSSSAWRERHVGCAAPAREGEHQRTRDLGTHIRPARCRSSVARWRRPTAPGDDATAGSVTVLTFTPRGVSLGTVPSLADAFRVLNELEAEGIVERYAVGGAMAMVFWAEPTVTFDLDIFALLPESETGSPIISLEPLYSVLRKRGFEVAAEHVMIHGTPVQFLVSPNELSDEAIQTAVAQELDGVPFRVMRPEHLCALWLQAGGAKRRERVEVLRQSGAVDDKALQTLLRKYGISG